MDAQERIAAARERLEKQKAKLGEQEAEQRATDEENLVALHEEHSGMIRVARMTVYVPGQPTLAVVRLPEQTVFTRYKQLVGKNAKGENLTAVLDAQAQVGRSSWIYPREDADRQAMAKAFPGLVATLGLAAIAMANGKEEEEGKD